MPKLVLIAKGQPREIEMGQELTIGRGYSNLLRLDGEEISRVHAIIYRRNQDFILRDLDSKNGVFVNGNRTAYAELGPGDLLKVGKYEMVFNPPSEFDMSRFVADAGSKTASSPSQNGSGQGADASDDFSRSQLFRAATPAANAAVNEVTPEPEICRDEVLIYTRAELDARLKDTSSTASAKAVDYQEEFFQALVQAEGSAADSDGFGGMVLGAIVKAVGADRGVIVLRNTSTNVLTPGAVVSDKDDVAVNSVVLRSGFSEGKAVLCPATADCGLFRDSTTVSRERIASLISVPLGSPDPIGLLYVDRQGEADGFNRAHLLAVARVARLLETHLREMNEKLAQKDYP